MKAKLAQTKAGNTIHICTRCHKLGWSIKHFTKLRTACEPTIHGPQRISVLRRCLRLRAALRPGPDRTALEGFIAACTPPALVQKFKFTRERPAKGAQDNRALAP